MKALFIAIGFILFLENHANGQNSEKVLAEKRAQNIFVEIGGQGLLFTANYDTRFSKKRDGLGARAGIGYLAVSGNHATTVPISLNYLLGKGKNFFEMGLGTTLLAVKGNEDNFSFKDSKSDFVGSMSFSYRLQPVDGGFSFRAGLSPIFNKDFFMPYYAGLSLGYSF